MPGKCCCKKIKADGCRERAGERQNIEIPGLSGLGKFRRSGDVSKVKYNFSTFKKIPGKKNEKYERLSLTMNGVKHREKWTAEGLQPKDFMSYQL